MDSDPGSQYARGARAKIYSSYLTNTVSGATVVKGGHAFSICNKQVKKCFNVKDENGYLKICLSLLCISGISLSIIREGCCLGEKLPSCSIW